MENVSQEDYETNEWVETIMQSLREDDRAITETLLASAQQEGYDANRIYQQACARLGSDNPVEEREPVRNVEELNQFPFESFQDFREAREQGVIQVAVDRGVAREWVTKGIYSPTGARIAIFILAWMTNLSALILVINAIVTRTWLLLLALPLFPACLFLWHHPPVTSIRSWFILLTWAAFTLAIVTKRPWLLAIAGPLLLMWYSIAGVYAVAVYYLISAATQHEDLLCMLWEADAVMINPRP